mmetsp:Transcript_33323/g.91928  ORF Transcript_33323/g.91928 Transcript_33323/m.91928 type:complete len:231 (-) Transcript_33323:778-1470(-)
MTSNAACSAARTHISFTSSASCCAAPLEADSLSLAIITSRPARVVKSSSLRTQASALATVNSRILVSRFWNAFSSSAMIGGLASSATALRACLKATARSLWTPASRRRNAASRICSSASNFSTAAGDTVAASEAPLSSDARQGEFRMVLDLLGVGDLVPQAPLARAPIVAVQRVSPPPPVLVLLAAAWAVRLPTLSKAACEFRWRSPKWRWRVATCACSVMIFACCCSTI